MQPHQLLVTRTARYYLTGPDTGAVRQVWIALHGYAMLAARFAPWLGVLDDGETLLVVPEALSRFYLETARDGRHGNLIGATWLTREDREAELTDAIGYLDRLARQVAPRLRPGGRLGVLGFSQGAAMAARWAAHGTIVPDHLVLWGAPPPTESVAPLGLRLAGRVVTLVAGDRDPVAPAGALEEPARELSAAGVVARVERFPGGHELPPEVLRRVAVTATA